MNVFITSIKQALSSAQNEHGNNGNTTTRWVHIFDICYLFSVSLESEFGSELGSGERLDTKFQLLPSFW